ncbi:MAG: hypothetical protein K2O38_06220 [Muribaculaceae bacterium]|nr:hypothetical protein [Muribaculaceae bacterium]
MKKILMISGAALIAASAMAGNPAKQAVVESFKGAKLQRMDLSARSLAAKDAQVNALKKSKLSLLNQTLGSETTVDDEVGEETPATSLNARYYYPPINTFYSGSTPDGYTFPYQNNQTQKGLSWGLSGNKGYIPFLNLSDGAQAYEWSFDFWGPTDNDATPMTVTSENLPIAIEGPGQMISGPTLTAFAGEEQSSYPGEFVSRYLSGPDFAFFGVCPSQIFSDWEEAESDYDYWGVTTCPVNISRAGNTYTAEFAVNLAPVGEYADYYNETGCCMPFVNAINNAHGAKYDVSNIHLSAYIAMLPRQTQAYLLDQTWFVPYYTSTSDITLTVTVYGMDEEGIINTSAPIGAGEVILPAHEKAASELALVNLEAVDEEGFPTSNPLVIEGDACVFIEGFNDPSITYFTMFFNAGTEFDAPSLQEADVMEYYACNSAILVEFDAKEKGVEDAKVLSGSKIWDTSVFTYGSNAPFYGATDFNINYNILFPYVLNDEGGKDLVVTAPVEGGDVEYHFDAYFLMASLIEEGLMTAESDADWFTFEAVRGTVEINGQEYSANQVNIKAEALPAGVEGRQGVIKFRGYASDFDLVVTQGAGEENGIAGVAVANGKVELFDLQGRRLSDVPANGIYLERQGNKTVKRIARN